MLVSIVVGNGLVLKDQAITNYSTGLKYTQSAKLILIRNGYHGSGHFLLDINFEEKMALWLNAEVMFNLKLNFHMALT